MSTRPKTTFKMTPKTPSLSLRNKAVSYCGLIAEEGLRSKAPGPKGNPLRIGLRNKGYSHCGPIAEITESGGRGGAFEKENLWRKRETRETPLRKCETARAERLYT
jgi:hypothetical protein